MHRSYGTYTGVVQENVDTAVLLHRPSDRRCPALRRGHIEMESVVFEDITSNDVCPF
jgi:hypothetical protein